MNSNGTNSSGSRRLAAPNKRCSIFNDRYELVKCIGKGYTSEVFMARDIKNPDKLLAIKIYKEEFLTKEDGAKIVKKEVELL